MVCFFVGARFYAQIDAALTHNDVIEAELAKEIESARLFRLLTKLCTVVDRAELNGDFAWADYGDRYMLKLFRDYAFHQVRFFFKVFMNLYLSSLLFSTDYGGWTSLARHGPRCVLLEQVGLRPQRKSLSDVSR